MEGLGTVFCIMGMVMSCLAGIWFLITAFRESIWWGLGSLFLPFVDLIFLVMHWQEAKHPFGFALALQRHAHNRQNDDQRD